ncbi:hypothetical protein N9M56_03230 [Porticoccaceae bacterium]|nr:hypothetical protein [Porticoccaceae bacterium]MDA9565730.1 hypothetical protein [Porticoccaceae bacterium]
MNFNLVVVANYFSESLVKLSSDGDLKIFYKAYVNGRIGKAFRLLLLIITSWLSRLLPGSVCTLYIPHSYKKFGLIIKFCSYDHLIIIDDGVSFLSAQRFGNEMSFLGGTGSNASPSGISVELDRKRGNNIISWPNKSPVLGRVESGKFSKTSLMADFYSGYVVIEKLGHRKISDLDYEGSLSNYQNYNEFINKSGYAIKKTIVSNDIDTLEICVSILVPNRTREQIKPCHFSLTSEYWDMDSLYYSAKLGGDKVEKFQFGHQSFDQDSILNLNVVGTNGFCPTDGVLIIGDKSNKVRFQVNPTICFSLIRFSYDVVDENQFLLQISFVVQDIDETFRENKYQQNLDFKCTVEKLI